MERGELICKYIETAKMVADCITKPVPLAKLNENIAGMGVVEQQVETSEDARGDTDQESKAQDSKATRSKKISKK